MNVGAACHGVGDRGIAGSIPRLTKTIVVAIVVVHGTTVSTVPAMNRLGGCRVEVFTLHDLTRKIGDRLGGERRGVNQIGDPATRTSQWNHRLQTRERGSKHTRGRQSEHC